MIFINQYCIVEFIQIVCTYVFLFVNTIEPVLSIFFNSQVWINENKIHTYICLKNKLVGTKTSLIYYLDTYVH